MYDLKPCSCPKCGGSGFLTDLNITSGGTACPACDGQGILYPAGWLAADPKSDDELARLTQRKEYWKAEATCYRDDVVAAEATLRAVERKIEDRPRHSFDRNSSHTEDRYVCDCGYDECYQADDAWADELEALLKKEGAL